MFTFSVIYFVHSWSQVWKKEEDYGRLTANIKFSHFNMNEPTHSR